MSPIPTRTVYFPRLRLTGASAFNRIVQLPMMSYKAHPLDPGPLSAFSNTMFGESLPAREITESLRRLARTDVGSFKTKFGTAIEPILSDAIARHKKQYGLDTSTWEPTSDAARAAYTIDLSPPGGGHVAAVVSLEPHPDPRTLVGDPNLMRFLVSNFPYWGLPMSGQDHLNALTAGRQIDGEPIDWIVANMDRLRANAADAFLARRPMSDFAMLGSNSFVGTEAHISATVGRLAYQTAVFVTTGRHSQDGIVPWTSASHPDFPGGVACLSLHYGHNPIPGGDMVNVAVAGPLFKLIFRRGIRLARFYAEKLEGRFGKERAAALLLDPEVSSAFRSLLWKEDLWTLSDSALIAVLDASGGALLNHMREFNPNTVATLKTTEYDQARSREAWSAAIDSGVQASTPDAVPGVESTAPDAVVVDMGSAIASVAVVTPETNSFNPDNPIGVPEVDADVAAARALSESVDWNVVRDTVLDEIDTRTRDAIDAMEDPFSRSVEDLVKTIRDTQFDSGVQDALSSALLQSLAGDEAFAPIVERHGAEGARAIAALALGIPTYQRMSAASGSASVLDAAVRGTLLTAKTHWLAESAGTIQERLADADGRVTQTREELVGKQANERELEQRVQADPADATLAQQYEAAQKEVKALADKLAEAEHEREAASEESERREAEAKSTEEERRESEGVVEARGREVFRGEK